MAPIKVYAALLFMGASAVSPSSRRGCDFSVIDLEGAVDEVLARLPSNKSLIGEKFLPAVAGIEMGGITVAGLNKIRRFGPVLPHCVDGTRLLQVDLVNEGDVAFEIPWRTCTGEEGQVRLLAQLCRLSVILRVHRRGATAEYALRYEGPTLPVMTYNVYLDLQGAGQVARDVSRLLSSLFPSYPNYQWKTIFFPTFTKAFFKALG